MPEPTLLVVYHSRSGRTASLTESVISGARAASDIRVVERDAFAATVEDFRDADAVIFGTPENFGYMSGAIKDFLERVFYPCEHDKAGVPYAIYVSAGNDGTGAVTSIQRIISGLRMNEAQPALVVVGQPSEEDIAAAETLGATMAAGLEAGIF